MYSTGMTGQSSGRTKCVTPNVYQHDDVGARRSTGRPRSTRGRPSPPACWFGYSPAAAPLVARVGRDPEVVLREAGPPADRRVGVRPAASASTSSARACTRPAARGRCARPGSRCCHARDVAASMSRRASGSRLETRRTSAGTRCPTGCRDRAARARPRPRSTSFTGPSTSKSRRALNRCWWCGAATPSPTTFANSGLRARLDRHRRHDAR